MQQVNKYQNEMEKPVNLALLSTSGSSCPDIRPVLKRLREIIVLDPRCESIDLRDIAPVEGLAMNIMMEMYRDFTMKLPPLTNPVMSLSSLSERNDIILSVDEIQVFSEPTDFEASPEQKCGIKMGIPLVNSLKDFNCLSMIIAELLAYTTTHAADGRLDIVADQKKCKVMGLPYVNLIDVRKILNVSGLQPADSRNAIYEKLKKDWRLTYFCSNKIFSQSAMLPFAEDNKAQLRYYNENPKQGYPQLFTLFVPKPASFEIRSSANVEAMWRFLHFCRGVRGEDNRGIGVITAGYMWYSMTRATFMELSMAQDLLSLLNHYKLQALYSDTVPSRVRAILNSNKITVYSAKAIVAESDASVCGYYIHGSRPYLTFYDLDVSPPTVTTKVVEYPEIKGKLKTLRDKVALSCAYFYLHPLLVNCNLELFPTFRAHSGLVLVANIAVEQKKNKKKNKSDKTSDDDTKKKEKVSSKFEILVSRAYEANYVRNMYPFTRMTFAPLDPFFDYFFKALVIPRNIPRQTTSFDVVEYVTRTVPVRVSYHLDLDVVEQVVVEYNMTSVKASLFERLDGLSDLERYNDIRSIVLYPQVVITNDHYVSLVNQGYNFRTDNEFMQKYGFIVHAVENRPVVPVDDIVIAPQSVIELVDPGDDEPTGVFGFTTKIAHVKKTQF